MGERVDLTIKNHVADVMLNRPEKFNALDFQFFSELTEIGESLKKNSDVRAVVLHGAGDNFCAGIDIKAMQGDLSDGRVFADKAFNLPEGEVANFFQKPAHVWRELGVPVIAALKGVAFGGGCQIALGADMRFARADTRLSVMEIKWGIIPDMGISQSLPRLLRDDIARELIYTGREVDAEEALAIGLITRISDDPLKAAHEMAANISQKNPDAIRACKTLIDSVPLMNSEEGLRLEAKLQSTVLGKANQLEAVRANFEKREPIFK